MKCAPVIYELLKIVLKHKVREFLHLVSNKYSFLVFQTYFRLVKNYIRPFPLIETSSRPFLLVNRAIISHLSRISATYRPALRIHPTFSLPRLSSNHLFPLVPLMEISSVAHRERELINHNFSQTYACVDIRSFIGVEWGMNISHGRQDFAIS